MSLPMLSTNMPNDEVIKQLEDKVNFWFGLHSLCKWIHWIVGILGVTMSTLAASSAVHKDVLPYLSVVAAVCFGIMGFVNPQKQAALFIRAYRLLEPAIREYKFSDLTLKELLNVHKMAEDLLNDGEVGESRIVRTIEQVNLTNNGVKQPQSILEKEYQRES